MKWARGGWWVFMVVTCRLIQGAVSTSTLFRWEWESPAAFPSSLAVFTLFLGKAGVFVRGHVLAGVPGTGLGSTGGSCGLRCHPLPLLRWAHWAPPCLESSPEGEGPPLAAAWGVGRPGSMAIFCVGYRRNCLLYSRTLKGSAEHAQNMASFLSFFPLSEKPFFHPNSTHPCPHQGSAQIPPPPVLLDQSSHYIPNTQNPVYTHHTRGLLMTWNSM